MTLTKNERDWLQALVNISGMRGAERATTISEKTIRSMLKEKDINPNSRWKLKNYLNELVEVE